MLGGARYICKPGDSLTKVLIKRPGIKYCSVPSQNKENVVISPRIERGPTDILKALASTVGVDHTAFHYKYPDDPYFYPDSEIKKKVLALSMESGRKSARYVFDNNPGFFKNQLSDPPIKKFFVKSVVSAESKPTEEMLLSAIEQRNVLKAIEVYEALEKENHDVSESTKQCLLELTCFYNCEDKPNEELEEKWFIDEGQSKKDISIWMHQGFAEKLFEKMDSSCPLANSAIIQGMLKYDEITRARKIFEEAKIKKVKLSVGVYNMFLSNLIEETGGKNVIIHAQKILNEMSEGKIRPNVGTLNAILKSLVFSQDYSKINFTLEIMKEFENIGIEPSLGSYGYLFMILSHVPARRKLYHNLSCEIMTEIENKKFEILHPSDFKFFKNSSTAFSFYYHDHDLSLRLLDMYFRNNNSRFITTFFEERSFFKDLCPTIFNKKPIETSMDIYRRYFFRTYDPTLKIFGLLISVIGKNNAPQYLIDIWKDIKEMNMNKNLNLLSHVLSAVVDFSDEESGKVFHAAGISYMSLMETGKYEYRSTDINVLSNILIAFVKSDDEENILKLLSNVKKRWMMNLNQHAVEFLFNYALSKQKISLLLESLRMAADSELPEVSEMASKSLPLLTGDSKAWATELMNKKKEENKSEKTE